VKGNGMNSVIDYSLTSEYILMSDGIKIAADYWLPVFSDEQTRIPVIIRFTRYWRGYELEDDRKELQPIYSTAKYWNDCGYAFVIVDTRGSGASFGYREGEFSSKEIDDLGEIVTFLSKKDWCNGTVVVEGTSYSANLALLSSLNNPTSLRVVHGTCPDYDGYAHLIAPGGISNKWLAETFSGMIQALDRNDWQEVLRYNPRKGGDLQPLIKGVRPVDNDTNKVLLNCAIREHSRNLMFSLAGEDFSARDLSTTLQQSTRTGSLYNYHDRFSKCRAVVDYEAGWFDAGTVAGALAFFQNVDAPMQVIIGPWNHGCQYYSDPLIERQTRFYALTERSDFLRSYIEGALIQKQKKSIVYYTLGRKTWRVTTRWPVNGDSWGNLFLHSNNKLAGAPDECEYCSSQLRVDLSTTTGVNNRWHTQIGAKQVLFPDRSVEDQKLLVFDSEPVIEPLEITGEIELKLFLSVNGTRGGIFVYFELITPEGEVILITEAQLNLEYRSRSQKPLYLGLERNLLKAERQVIIPGEVHEIDLKMLPISVLIPSGYRARFAFAGADCDTFDHINNEGSVLTVLHNQLHPSCVRFPVIRS
jgi:uncharacterized protein